MSERDLYPYLVYGWLALAPIVFVLLLFVTAPYGRHSRGGWGPRISNRAGWLVMEVPAVLVLPLCFVAGERRAGPAAAALLLLWEVHYVNRALVYPFRVRRKAGATALVIALGGLAFNVVNGYLNGRHLFTFGPVLPQEWLWDPRFLAGTALFLAGLVINVHSDGVLLRLRARSAGGGYQIPHGGLYRFVSCPNYLGELLEWTGWAIATWSLPGLAFALWTAANLVPRARSHHLWYHAEMPGYPRERRAILPFIF